MISKFSSNGRSVRYKDFIRSFRPSESKPGDRDLAVVRALSAQYLCGICVSFE